MTNEAKSTVEIILALSETQFTAIDGKMHEMHGVGFAQLAADYPADAYNYVATIAQVFARKTDIISIDGIKLTGDLDGQDAVTGAAMQVIERMKVDTDIEPVDVIVSVFGKPRFRDSIRGRKTRPLEVIAFHVEPPNISF